MKDYLRQGAPDYSQSTKEYTTWAYSATYDGWYQTLDENGKYIRLENSPKTPIAVTSKESLREYKDAGFNTLMINYVFPVQDFERFSTSRTKQIMDWAHEVGLKCFIFENLLRKLAATTESLINPEKANGRTFFRTQEELNEFVYIRIKDMIKHPAFYGFSIFDEPPYTMFPAFGQLYKALQAARPGTYLCMNLLGLAGKPTSSILKYCENAENLSFTEGFTKYITHYADCTGAPYLQVDVYPFRGSKEKPFLTNGTIRTPQFLANFCKERDMKLHYVLQTSAFSVGFGDAVLPWLRTPTERELHWQAHITMAFGVTSFSYWNYYPVVNTASEHYDEKSTFLDLAGNKNDTYYYMQALHKQMQSMAKTILNFRYQGSRVFVKGTPKGNTAHLEVEFFEREFARPVTVEAGENSAFLVNELYDKEKGYYGYYIVNAADPFYENEGTVSLTFTGFDRIQVCDQRGTENKQIEGGRLSVTLKTGEGIFVIPY